MRKEVQLFDASRAGSSSALGAELPPMRVSGIDDPLLRKELGEDGWEQLKMDVELLEEAGDAFDEEKFLAGTLSPMFFGSAINNFGLEGFLQSFSKMMPPPRARVSDVGMVEPTSKEFTGFVFKVQANMNPAHRDRVAFLRICSGRFSRKTKVLHVRTGREVRLANPTQFVARERTAIEEAFAGDVIGVYDPGFFQVGDALTGGTKLEFEPIPSFAPEYFKRLVMVDPLRRKQLVRGTTQLAQEGTVQLYQPPDIRTGWRNARCAGLQIAPWWAKSGTRRFVMGRFGIHIGLEATRQGWCEGSVEDESMKFANVVLRVQAPPGQSLASRPVASLAVVPVTGRLMRR